MSQTKPRVGISACLLGQRVRYDGRHQRATFLIQALGPFVTWVPVCPEVEVGMGVPREAIRLVGSARQPRLLGERSGRDWTAAMQRYAERRVTQLVRLRLSGYIFKSDSPSCGLERVRVYRRADGAPIRTGRGLFARVLTERRPLLPVEDERRLNTPQRCARFIARVFAYQRWPAAAAASKSSPRRPSSH